jgi:hypothetical protein
MIPATEIIHHGGKSNLIRIAPEALLGVIIPSSSKRFLIDVGLPKKLGAGPRDELGIRIDATQGKLPTLSEHLVDQEEDQHSELDLTKYRRFESSFEAHLCISEADKGCVVRVDRDGSGHLVQLFVNSGIEHFVVFPYLVEKASGGCVGLTPAEQKQFVRNEERKFRQIDRRGLDHWWGAILEEWKAAVG